MTTSRTTDGAGGLIRLEQTHPDRTDRLERRRTIVIVPLSPVEFHGRHLPFGTDLVLAEAFSVAAGERFLSRNPSWTILLHPTVPMGADCLPHPASVSVSPGLVHRTAMEIGRHYVRHGFPNVVFMTGHGGFGHGAALERAARRLNRRFRRQGARVIAPLGRVMFGLWSDGVVKGFNTRLDPGLAPEDEEAFKHELHAGWWETSVVLYHRPAWMTDAYRSTPHYLPPVQPAVRRLLDLVARLLPGRQRRRLEEARQPMEVGMSWFWGNTRAGYLGYPSRASSEMGRASTELAGDAFADFFQAIYLNGLDPREAESVFSLPGRLAAYGVGAGLLFAALVGVLLLV